MTSESAENLLPPPSKPKWPANWPRREALVGEVEPCTEASNAAEDGRERREFAAATEQAEVARQLAEEKAGRERTARRNYAPQAGRPGHASSPCFSAGRVGVLCHPFCATELLSMGTDFAGTKWLRR